MDFKPILIYIFIVVISCANLYSVGPHKKYSYSNFLRDLKKNKYEIIIKEKIIVGAPSFESAHEVYQKLCSEWNISKRDIKNLFITSKEVSGFDYIHYYESYPCEIIGYFTNQSSLINFYINSANTAIIKNKDFGELNIIFTNAARSFDDGEGYYE